MTSPLTLGDRVAYSSKFLRATAGHAVAGRRGVIVREGPGQLVGVKWDDGHEGSALSSNLVRQDRIHLEPV